MNVLCTLFRLVCSWTILLVLALYIQSPAHISPEDFYHQLSIDSVLPLVSSLNWVTITAAILLVLAVLKIQEALWNIGYATALLLFIVVGLCDFLDPVTVLPAAIENNRAVLEFCALPRSYPLPACIIIAVFFMGWLCSTAPFRITFSCLLSIALWYGFAEVFYYMVGMWAKSPTPSMPELLHAIQSAPWIIAAIPGAFFLVYAILTAFIETFISRREEARKKRAEKKKADEEKSAAEELSEEGTSDKALAAPEDNPRTIIIKPSTKAAAPAAPKLVVKKPAAPPAEEASKAEDKPAEEAKPAAEAPKAEDKPAEEAKPAAEAPKAEDKPAEEAKPAAEAPKAEDKPAEEAKPAAETPKAEDKPAEEAKPAAEAPKAEDKPAEEAKPAAESSKAEDKPAEDTKAGA